MWEIGPNGRLGRRWPTPNRRDGSEGDDDDDISFYILFNINVGIILVNFSKIHNIDI